jgi:glycosyltransferase involved in cell wall biosynthesis
LRTRTNQDHYDLVWFADLATFLACSPPPSVRSVVDVARVESLNLRREVPYMRRDARRIARATAAIDRWSRAEAELGQRTGALVVCNEIDRHKLGHHNVVVIPTSYAAPSERRTDWAIHSPPTILLQGTLFLSQNVDAAMTMVDEILPRVHDQRPDAELRIVGPGPPRLLETFNRRRGVCAPGWVSSMEEELAGADVVVAPLRHGGGIHVKVIEAFAREVPVITTDIGVEGTHGVPGKHLIVSNDADSLANSIVGLLEDDGRRRTLATNAFQLFTERFETGVVRQQICDLALAVAASR